MPTRWYDNLKKNYLNMKSLIINLLIFSFLSFFSFSQVNGYFGKKNFLDVNVNLHLPLLYNFNNQLSFSSLGYLNKNGVLEQKMPKINTGFNFSYLRVIQRNIGLGLEMGLSNFRVVPNIGNSDFYTNAVIEMIGVRKFSILPKIEFSYEDALLPIGISNQIGVGVNYFSAVERDYIGSVSKYNESSYSSDLVSVSKDNYYNFETAESVKSYTILYKLTMRIPINKYLLCNFGFRYTFNFMPNLNDIIGTISSSSSEDYVLDQESFTRSIKNKENRSLIMFETGITFSF